MKTCEQNYKKGNKKKASQFVEYINFKNKMWEYQTIIFQRRGNKC